MGKQRWIRIIMMVLMVLVVIVPAGMAFGDVGGFSGGTDYSSGGGYSGSGSDSDSGITELLFWLLMLAFEDGRLSGGEIAIIALAIVAAVAVRCLLKRSSHGGGNRRAPVKVSDSFSMSQVQPIFTLMQRDPQFSQAAITEKVSNWYVQMQNAWTAGDFEPMRPYFTDALFAQFNRQLDAMTKRGEINHVDRIAVLGVDIDGWYEESDEECLVVKVRTRIVDYITNADGQVISGSKTAEKFMTYRYVLARTAGTQTATVDGLVTINCPNCAAALNINKTAQCPYCDSIVTAEEHDWVISSIQGLEQITA